MGMKSLLTPAAVSPRPIHLAMTRMSAPPERPVGLPGVTAPYSGKSLNANVAKLGAIVSLFGLTPTEVAKVVGCSRSYVSRILSQTDPLVGSDVFWRRLEGRLGQVIDQRQRQFFRIAPVNVRSVERAAKDVLDVAA
jgi:hypothetical protein